MELIFALLLGLVLGAGLTFLLFRSSRKDAESVAEALSAKVVGLQTKQILELAETKFSGKKELIDGTLRHMKDDLNKVEKLMHDIREKNTKVDTRLESAAVAIKDLAVTADGLKLALSGNSARGQWGERMAEDVLRLSGLVEGINYIKQTKFGGTGSRPDFTFVLPQNLRLNMDVKFPFSNYQLYLEAKTDAEREKFKKEFLSDVKKRIKEVQTRDYINPEEHTMDYVLLFIPNEQIFTFIHEIGSALIDEAMRGKTILCSPMSLYAILAVVRQSIDSFQVEAKSREMLSLFGAFRSQWEKFKEQMESVKTRFESVQKGYDELIGTRERQLEKPLSKIEQIRMEKEIPEAAIEEAFDSLSRKHIDTASHSRTKLKI